MVVFAGGFRRAQEVFGTSASALHQRLSKLEEGLDFSLLDRSNPRNIIASGPGELLYRFVAPFFEGLHDIVLRASGQTQRILRIASTQAILQNTLVDPLARYRREWPEAEIRIEERPWLQIIELVTAGKVDLGFAPEPPAGHELIYDGIYESEYQLICPLRHPLLKAEGLTLEMIASEPLILFQPKSATGNIVWSRFETAGVPFRPFCIADNVGTIQHFVSQGLGVAIVSGISILDQKGRRFGVRPIGQLFGSLSQGVMFRRHWILRRGVRAFLELLPQGTVLAQRLKQEQGEK